MVGRSRSGVGVGVGADIFGPELESELESLEIRRLCSPGYNNMGLVRRVGHKASELA